MYEFWYDYVKPRQRQSKIMLHWYWQLKTETEDFYKDIANDVQKWFYTSNYSKNDKDHFQ